jgi:hypothetical protein
MGNKQDITVLDGLYRSCRDAINRVSTGGLEARKSLAQGNALCHGRGYQYPKPQRGVIRLISFDYALSGLDEWGRLPVRRALPCAVDYRAFSPALNIQCLICYKFFIPK